MNKYDLWNEFINMIQQDSFIRASYTTTANLPPSKGSLLSIASLLTLFWRNERIPVMKTWKNQSAWINPHQTCEQIERWIVDSGV